ncbi:MAG: hypothetical protein H6815_08495 [Phycisphaeraceae bacterium]|nr:hypothetical protein [Phycisphaerales bacterium]MCB9860480.1 hypothetical protein [Phycisphaeraceae bacterium]
MSHNVACRAFTIVEVVMSLLIVSLVLLAGLRTAAATGSEARIRRERDIGRLLADQLLAEIMALPSEDPNETPVFGMELDETGTSRRDVLDDIDDYNGWTESPVRAADGTIIAQYSQWRRDVEVDWISTIVPIAVPTDTRLKGVTVTVYAPSGKSYTRTALRSMHEYRDRSDDEQVVRIGVSLTAGVDGRNITETAASVVVLENSPEGN